jgi:hypothetical protein
LIPDFRSTAIEGKMENVRFEEEIAWDGSALSIWAVTPTGRVLCLVPRDTIHMLSIYNDAIEREIERDRHDIVARFQPALAAKIALHAPCADHPVFLSSDDLSDRD